jgi:hypothetical protein
MKAKFFNSEIGEIETIDTENLINDSGDDWNKEMLISYIKDVCPMAKKIEVE